MFRVGAFYVNGDASVAIRRIHSVFDDSLCSLVHTHYHRKQKGACRVPLLLSRRLGGDIGHKTFGHIGHETLRICVWLASKSLRD